MLWTIFALLLCGVAIAIGESPQPCAYPRVCRATPEASSYTQSILSTGVAPHDENTHHRHVRNVVRIIDVAAINPAYVSAYSPEGYDSTTQSDILGEIRRLGLRLDQLQQLVQQKRSSTPTTPAPTTPPPLVPNPAVPLPPAPTMPGTPGSARVPVPDSKLIGLAVLSAKCAACHQQGHLLPEQRFTLLDGKGNLVSLTDRQKVTLSNKTRLGTMPPPANTQGIPPLSDAEYAAVADLIGF